MRSLLMPLWCLLLAVAGPAPGQQMHGQQWSAQRHIERSPRILAQQQVRSEPLVLVASPELRDPNFAESVVLVLFPASGGATGVILNRPTTLQWKDAFPDDAALAKRTEAIYFGGPVTLGA